MKKFVKFMLAHLPYKRKIFAILRQFHLPRSIYSRLRFSGAFEVSLPHGGRFQMISHGLSSENQLFWQGLHNQREALSLQVWMALCQEAQTIFDVGAHLGLYSLVAAAVNPQAAVFGFEPLPAVYQMFCQNVQLNGYAIHSVHTAVSDQDGTTTLFYNPASLPAASLHNNGRQTQETVPATTLFTFIQENEIEQVDLMKIDVETFEPAVLAGMQALLQQMKPTLIIEILNDKVGQQVESLLDDTYLFFHIHEQKGLQRQDHLRRLEPHSRNYLLCTAETFDHLPDFLKTASS